MGDRGAFGLVFICVVGLYIVTRPKVWLWTAKLPTRLLWRATLGRRRR